MSRVDMQQIQQNLQNVIPENLDLPSFALQYGICIDTHYYLLQYLPPTVD